jgi:hypothetical protein
VEKVVEKTRKLKMLRDRNGHGKVKFNIYYLLDPTSSPNFVRIIKFLHLGLCVVHKMDGQQGLYELCG